MVLPYADKSFDVAVMALVIFFVPAYAWDMHGGGFPWTPVVVELRELGQKVTPPPSVDASRIDMMRQLWTDAGTIDVETCEITVQRTFVDFDDFLSVGLTTPSIGPIVRAMQSGDVDTLKARLRDRLPVDANGRIMCSARANAVKGRVRK